MDEEEDGLAWIGRMPNNASAGRRETPLGDQAGLAGRARRVGLIAEKSPGNTPRVHPALVAAVVWTAR